VRLHGAEVLGTADEAVEVVGLPEGIQGAEAGLVDETARNAFPALERVGEGFAVPEGEEHVDVIGHDDVAPEVVALAVEVLQAVGDDLGEAWITQGAGAVRGVEVFVELVGELAVVAGFGDVFRITERWLIMEAPLHSRETPDHLAEAYLCAALLATFLRSFARAID
jgi:hypothetical protein